MLKKRRKNKARLTVVEECTPSGAASPDRIAARSRRSRTLSVSRRRISMGAVAFSLAFAFLGVRLGVVSLSPASAQGAPALAQGDDPDRKEIVDRNGLLLAVNLPVRALEIAGREVWSPRETANAVATVFPNIDTDDLERKLADGRYVEIRERLTPAQEEAVFALGLTGVRFSPRTKRFYPQGETAAHVIGHTEPGKGGVMGLERVLDERRARGPLVAALDARAQQIVEQELSASLAKFHAKAAMAAVMNVQTGEVIALASLPTFDPNEPGASPADFRRNRAVYDRYELGSAFKLFTAAAALETGVATENSTYDARGGYKVADKTIRDFHGENRILTLSEVVQYSSNIGAARMAGDLGPERQEDALRKFGLLDALPIELAERRAPELPRKWGPVECATISYGHGISVTPLHLLAAVSSIVNGGVWRAPEFVKVNAPQKGVRVISESTSAIMRRVMRRVIMDGTASYADVDGYYIIGKTATADKPSHGGYNRNARISTFVGAFPGYAPRYAVLVTLDEPQAVPGTYGYATAGWNAAPTFSAITRRLAPLLGVMPIDEASALAAFETGDAPSSRRAALVQAEAEGAP
ncbi:MAG: penicillin-binding protein 2 [Parvularculaceae bacterium]|nr:penicillin-binding protein 2 [Parvularculaceae bacterium]